VSAFDNYDQWKTSNPDEDFDDSICANCGEEIGELPWTLLDFMGAKEEMPQWYGFCSEKCQKDYHE